ncbi:MAG: small-conductance mechanosensitive channel [Actinobacteria bacterium]|nr:small-conductance mechanosensitive channel [Actinomycetota bacterium]
MNLNLDLKEVANWFFGAPIRVLVILILSLILQKVASRAITRALSKVAEADFIPGEKTHVTRQRERARTAASVLNSSSKALIGLIAGAMILGELGVDLGPLVASAGVVGFAVGLGAQTIVRDVFSGIIMLIEDQYGVGDTVEVLEVKGVVETVGLRITTVRDRQGTLWYLRNGEILKVGNKSQKSRG